MQTFEEIMSDLKGRKFKPVYFLMGEEPYYIDAITDYIEKNLLREDEKAFNQAVVYGSDVDLGQIINMAKRVPMMAEYNLVIVKEAQNVKGIDGAAEGNVDPFALYVENPPKSTVLVINYKGKKLDSRRKLAKLLDKEQVLFESKSLYDNQVGKWITEYLRSQNIAIEPNAAEIMAAHLGTKLSVIVMELDKLKVAVGGSKKITAADIERHVGISKDFNIFELQTAIGARDFYRSALIAKHMGAMAKHSIIPDIAVLYGFFTKVMVLHGMRGASSTDLAKALKINPFFVKDYQAAARNYNLTQCASAISILREYDAYSKGIDAPPIGDDELLNEMVFKIISC
ncbi:MAG: DNA polymerase III subunit delta [Salinivirgaceae bacterium]|nr:DNA polymerase III subunit delta [Salinivirgaceae bacterium]